MIAIRETKNGIGKMYYTATDNLGSINMIVDGSTGQIVDDLSYDAWGRNRNPYDWTYSNITLSNITDRGYTGHEHMTNFGLINMNGRVYDPYISQFLSPDPFVQDPTNTQNYNRFSYVLNNPLKYTDPSGYNYSSNNADGGTSYYIDGVKVSGTMLDLLFKNNDFLSNIYRFDYVRGSTDRNARNFSITFKNDLKFGSKNRAIGISIDWSETKKVSQEDKIFGYKGEFVNVSHTSFFEFDELNKLIQEARRGMNNGERSASGGGDLNYTDRVGGLDCAGYVVDGIGYSAELTAKTTYRYGTHTATATQITKQNAALWGKVALRVNVLGAAIGTIDCTAQGVSDYKNGNSGLATFEFSKAAGYTAGIVLIAISPFTAGSTAVIGGYIIAGTSAVDIGGDIGLYIYGRSQ